MKSLLNQENKELIGTVKIKVESPLRSFHRPIISHQNNLLNTVVAEVIADSSKTLSSMFHHLFAVISGFNYSQALLNIF